MKKQIFSFCFVEEEIDENEKKEVQIRIICKHFRKQIKVNKKAKRQMKKVRLRVIKRTMKEIIRKVFMLQIFTSQIFMFQVNSVFGLSDFTSTLASSKAFIEVSILAIIDVKNTAVKTVEDIVASASSSVSHFVLFSLSTVDVAMDIDFNIFDTDVCVRKQISSCFFVIFALSAVIDVIRLDVNFNIIRSDYCVRKQTSSCFFVIVAFSVVDSVSPTVDVDSFFLL